MLWRLRKATVENIIWSKIPPWLQSNEWIEHAFLNLPPPLPLTGYVYINPSRSCTYSPFILSQKYYDHHKLTPVNISIYELLIFDNLSH